MGIFDVFRKKKEIDLETRYRENLLRHGRITDGEIIDNEVSETGEIIVYYIYSVQGADFESSEILNEEQAKEPIKYAPGASIGVRYDPKHHGSSILV
jgi:hypothetical protein